ncbi:MAG TPA: VOC family protein [Myxococcales bacterium]|nr:VOC family protein [Myxococcales bacterium]
MIYTSDAQATRDFIRDKLRLPHTDVGEGWLIFDLPEGDLGCHPIEGSDPSTAGTHEISFYCDDIERTVADLRSRGVEFKSDVADRGWGLVTELTMPGGVEVQLYQPKYAKAKKAPKRAGAPRRSGKRAQPARRRKAKGRRRSRR